ncbi:MAG: helix-turn-helix domain-containing protein [Maribacter sp.]
MEFILNAGLGIGALMLLLLLFKKNKNQSDYLFLGWILITLGQIAFYEVTIFQFEIHGFWAIPFFSLPMLGAPLLFLYILSLTGHRVSWKTALSHLVIYVIYVVLFFVFQQKDNIDLTAVNGSFDLSENPPLWMQYYAIPLAISGLVYCIWDLLLLRKHRQTIVALFSFDEKINLKWLSYVVYAYLVLFVLASFLIFGATQFQLFSIENAFAMVGITLSLMLIAFGFYGFRQTAIFSNIDTQAIPSLNPGNNLSEKVSYSKSGLTPEKIENLANRLTEHMEIEKPFLDENLNLSLLAVQSEISQPHLSQVINQHFKMNFYDFVNRYRIEEAKRKLSTSDFDHLSVLGIAFECGFKSKSSFNRYFKKYTGVSPSEFKKKHIK